LGGVEAELMYPRSLPDLFKGSQLTIVGRYKNARDGATVRLTGKSGSRDETFSFSNQNFPSEKSDNQFLPRLWATRRVGYLLEQIRLNGENRELVDEIVSLGTRFGIVTPYTSFLVTEDMKDLARTGRRDDRFRMLDGLSQRSSGAAPAVSGESAVIRSRAERELKESDAVSSYDEYLTNLSTVGSKTFILKDGVWIDTLYKADGPLPRVVLKFGSDEFFELLEKEPELAEFFALGDKVIVVFKDKVYQVT